MIINFAYKGKPAYAFAVFNFNQVCDAALLFAFTEEDHKSKKLLVTYTNEKWQGYNTGTNDDEFLEVINEELSRVLKMEKLNAHFTNDILYNSLLATAYCS